LQIRKADPEGKPHGKDKEHWERAGKSKVSVESRTDKSGSEDVELSSLAEDRPVFLCSELELAHIQIHRSCGQLAYDEIVAECDAEIWASLNKAG
jgi:hypothetical protein